jgi:hypothetical protein
VERLRLSPWAEYLLGIILAAKKDYSGAAEQLRAYLDLAPDADDVAKVKMQLDEIDKLQTQIIPKTVHGPVSETESYTATANAEYRAREIGGLSARIAGRYAVIPWGSPLPAGHPTRLPRPAH